MHLRVTNPTSHKANRPATKRIIDANDIIPGDILMFRPSIKDGGYAQDIIIYTQALVREKHGHYDTTHVAVCVGKNADGHPIIAHVHETHETMGYIKETMDSFFSRDNDDRPFIVYRHVCKEKQKKIADIAGNNDNHSKGIYWALKTGIRSLFGLQPLDPIEEMTRAQRGLSINTICSKFAIEVLKLSHDPNRDKFEYFPVIHSTSSPKALESFLYKSKRFKELCYPGKNYFNDIHNEIKRQVNRFKNRNDDKSFKKYQDAERMYLYAQDVLANNPELDELAKTVCLIKYMLPIFSRSTGLGFFNTTSYQSLLARARKMGIFERDIADFSLEELRFSRPRRLSHEFLDKSMLSI